MSSSEEPLAKRPRWTYDQPCTLMETTERLSPSIELEMPGDTTADVIIIGLFASDETISTDAIAMKYSAGNDVPEAAALEAILATTKTHEQSFDKGNKVGVFTPVVRFAQTRYALMGLGKEEESSNVAWGGGIGLKVGAVLAKLIDDEKGCSSALVFLPETLLFSKSFVRDFATSFYCALYSDNRFRTGDRVRIPAKELTRLLISPVVNSKSSTTITSELKAHFDQSVLEGISFSKGQYLAMDIVNAPHNVLNSISLANVAKELADKYECLTCSILDKHQCELRGMGAYLGVARGSETEPQFIHLTYKPPAGSVVKKKIGFVGKGVLFDTGGYNIKVQMMELMKFDCGGAAAVFGAAKTLAELKPANVELHFIVAACENMIGPKAYVPSDILTASNGKTIEIGNTDAEGRLTLADALVYTDKEVGCDSIVELSTLTGACMVALGKGICGVFTTNDELAAELDEASKKTGEKAWRMPMAMEYKDQLESIIADCKNLGPRTGGAITAALFLQNFVDGNKPFAHVDIAGPAWNDKTGATGFGSKLLSAWAMDVAHKCTV